MPAQKPAPIPDNLPELTRQLVQLRKKPSTQARFKAYPAMLQRFDELLTACDDAQTLTQVLDIDDGYYLLAGYRQRVIEKLLRLQRTSANLRLYAQQLMLFGDVDAFGEADTEIDKRVTAIEAEADRLENG
jgi:hypothetical protein